MSRTKPTDREQLALTQSCSHCGSGPGDWCTLPRGEWAQWLHGARTSVVYQAWRIGYADGQVDEAENTVYGLRNDHIRGTTRAEIIGELERRLDLLRRWREAVS